VTPLDMKTMEHLVRPTEAERNQPATKPNADVVPREQTAKEDVVVLVPREQTGELLDAVTAFIRLYLVLTHEQAVAVALWVLHTHTVDALGITPYLAITSAEKESGKTRLLETLEQLVAKPWLTGSVSAATLARKIDHESPTLLLDESDAAFKGDREYAEALRGVLNTGFKASGIYSRCVGTSGTNLTVGNFKTFCAKAIAGIGGLPDTVVSRAITIRLRRKAADETVARWRQRIVEQEAGELRVRIEQWAEENIEHLAQLQLEPLEGLSDRRADIWEPLLGIAYVAGIEWFGRAREAAITLAAAPAAEDESTGVRLLADIRTVFDATGTDHIFSETLVSKLNALEESPWAEWFGKGLTKNGLAKMLRRFEIRPRTVRVRDSTAKGYGSAYFADAWSRYLTPDAALSPVSSVTPSQPAPANEEPASPNRHTTATPTRHTTADSSAAEVTGSDLTAAVTAVVTDADNPGTPHRQSDVTAVTAVTAVEGEEGETRCPVCESSEIFWSSGRCRRCGERARPPVLRSFAEPTR
jgi:hypothetical protein